MNPIERSNAELPVVPRIVNPADLPHRGVPIEYAMA